MAHNLHRSIVTWGVLLLASSAGALYEWMPPTSKCDSVHDYKPAPFTGQAPPLPDLPEQYSMNVQANILQKGWASELEEHYDGPNKKAAVFFTFNGTTTQTIFNFNQMEKYDVYANGTCVTRPGTLDWLGMFTKDKKNRPAMATVKQMWHMNKMADFSYVGETWVRGVKVHHWTACQEMAAMGAKFQIDWYFTHQDFQTAWGSGQIPLRAVVNGTAGNVNMQHAPVKGSHRFNHIYDFTSFQVGPIQNPAVFEVPKDVVCSARSDSKEMPDIPDNFQMDMEMMCPMVGNSLPFQQSVRYDWDHRLVETFTKAPIPQMDLEKIEKMWASMKGKGKGMSQEMDADMSHDDMSHGMSHDDMSHEMGDGGHMMPEMDWSLEKMIMRSFSQVDDHKAGLRYTTEKSNNTCRVDHLPMDDMASSMSHGKAMLRIHGGQKAKTSSFTYQGRSTFRNLPVDAWGDDSGGMIQKVFFLADKFPMGAKMHGGSAMGHRPPPSSGGKPSNPGGSGGGGGTPQPDSHHSMQGAHFTGKPGDYPFPTGQPGSGNWQDMIQKRKEAMQKKPQSGSDGMMDGMMDDMMPDFFPVLVGMVFKNRTAVSTRSMSALFGDIMTQKVFEWERESPKQQDVKIPEKSHHEHVLDHLVGINSMHDTVQRHAGETDMNIFHFQPLHTDDSMFQVSQCYSPEERSHALLHIPTSYNENVRHHKADFSIAMRKAIAEVMGVSYLQISDLNPTPYRDSDSKADGTNVVLSLLGRPPIQSKTVAHLSITEMKDKLIKAISNGISFKVKYDTHTKSFMVDKDQYTLDYGSSMESHYDHRSPAVAANTRGKQRSGDSDKGFSSAAVAGIAISMLVLGCIVALVAITIYRKRQHPEEPVIPYKLSKK